MSTILFVSHVVPYPPSAGNELRIANLIRWLKRAGHEIVYLLNAGTLEPGVRAEVERHVDHLYLLDREYDGAQPREEDWRSLLARATRPLGLEVERRLPAGKLRASVRRHLRSLELEDSLAPEPLLSATRALCRRHSPRAVVAEYVFAAPCLDAVPPGIMKLIDTHDVFSRRMDRVIRYGIDDPHHLSERRERHYLLKSDVIIAIQSLEADVLRRLAPERETITIGIDFPAVSAIDVARVKPGRLLIVGSDNPLNVHGASEFRLHAWPRIARECPEATVRVVGKLAARLQSDDERFQLAGWRAQLDEEWSEAAIVLNPTVAGTGLKIKSVEALSRAKPLVATRNAVEGIAAAGAPPFVECGDWNEFARGTIELLRSPERRLALQERALAYAQANLDAERVYAPLARVLQRRLS